MIPASGSGTRWAGIATAILVLAIAVGVYGVVCLASSDNPPSWVYEVDLRGYFFPSLAYARTQLLQGHLPLWAPGQLLGVPFAAALQPAVFYPLLLPLLVLRPEHALIIHGLLHLVLAGFFTWIFLRTLGVAWTGAVVAAFAYLFSPDLAGSLYTTAYLSNQVWLPALLAAIFLVVEAPTRARGASLAVVTAMLLLSGYAQGAVYSLQVGGAYALFLLVAVFARDRALRSVVVLAGGVVLGVALAAVQLSLTLELASDGVRSLGGLNIFRAGGIGGEEARTIGAFFSVLTREMGGLAGLPFVLLAVVDRRARRHALFFLTLLVCTCDFQRGNAGYLFGIYYRLPSGNLFQVPERIAFVSGLSMAALVGIGADAASRWMSRTRWMGIVGAAAMAVAVILPRTGDIRSPRAWPPLVDAVRMYGEPGIVAAATLASAKDHDRSFVYQHPQDQRIPPRTGILHGIRMLYDYEPLLPGSYRRFFQISPDIRWRGRLTPVLGTGNEQKQDFPVSMRVLDSLAVRHYLDARGKRDQPVFATERKSAMSRAYAVDHAFYAASDDDALAMVQDAAFDPARAVVLTSSIKVLEETPAPFASDIRITTDLADEVAIDARCDKPCAVVLSDLAYPGWLVEVDSQRAQLLTADYLLRAVVIAAGAHEIRFRYRPTSFTIGAGISAASVLLVIALALGGRRRA